MAEIFRLENYGYHIVSFVLSALSFVCSVPGRRVACLRVRLLPAWPPAGDAVLLLASGPSAAVLLVASGPPAIGAVLIVTSGRRPSE